MRGLAGPPPVPAECGVGFTVPVIAGNRAYAVSTGRLLAYGAATELSIGNGYVVAAADSRVRDVYGRPRELTGSPAGYRSG